MPVRPRQRSGLCERHYYRKRKHGDPHLGGTWRGDPLAFAYAVLESATDECIIWAFGLRNGYGCFLDEEKKDWLVHRWVATKVHGPPQPGLQACHDCGNPACVNPRHIRWDTAKANAADKIRHGTAQRGEKHGCSKLTSEQVLAIREDTRIARLVAIDYRVSSSLIVQIRAKKVWRHI